MLLRYVQDGEQRKKILHACHVDQTAGHMGRTRTLHRIKERFMWHGMVKDVNEMVCAHSCSEDNAIKLIVRNCFLIVTVV